LKGKKREYQGFETKDGEESKYQKVPSVRREGKGDLNLIHPYMEGREKKNRQKL